jgi:6-phosphogluconolactonase
VSVEIDVDDDPARACSAILLSAVMAGGHVVLTGGSTPRTAYQELAKAIRELGVDPTDAVFWFGDERCVGPDDDRSNFKLAMQTLIDPLKDVASLDVRRIHGELGSVEGADAYERELEAVGKPKFEVVLLGLGPDGHTASLFPDQATLEERSRLVVGVPEAGLEPFVPRVTMTLTALAHTRQIVFLAEGEKKADAVLAAFGPDAEPNPHIPASLVAPLADDVKVLLDSAAAARLPGQR